MQMFNPFSAQIQTIRMTVRKQLSQIYIENEIGAIKTNFKYRLLVAND